MLAPIVSIKHYVQLANVGVASGSALNLRLVNAVAVGDAHSTTADVTEGSIVKAIHMDFWVQSEGATGISTQYNAILEKVVSGEPGATASEMLNLGSYPNKKNVLHSFQGNLSAAVDGVNTTPFIQGWFKIPKGKQRFGAGDGMVLSVTPTGQICNTCGMSVYKEYT